MFGWFKSKPAPIPSFNVGDSVDVYGEWEYPTHTAVKVINRRLHMHYSTHHSSGIWFYKLNNGEEHSAGSLMSHKSKNEYGKTTTIQEALEILTTAIHMEIGERADIEMKLSEKAMDHLTDSFKETAKYSSGKGEKGHVVSYYTWSGTVKFL